MPNHHRTTRSVNVQPSPYQQAILDWIMTGKGNAIVSAVAGSGKTSTLVMASELITDGMFLAFNKSIATELERRLPSSVQAKTFHGLMYGVMQRELNRRGVKGAPLFKRTDTYYVSDLFASAYGKQPELTTVSVAIKRLAGLAKGNLLHPDVMTDSDVSELIDAHGITWDTSHDVGDIIAMLRRVLRDGLMDWTRFDFDDYLYQGYFADLPIPRFTWVLVDEAQDTNLAQRAIVRRMLRRDSRCIFVGDERQAIYGFRGADSNSMANIASDFVCTWLPLSISYRCPKAIVEHARSIVPHIESSPTAKDGMVRRATEWDITSFVSTDLVMCRNTAPLVTLAYKMIGQRIGCKILGREIGTALVSLVRKVSGKRGTLDTLSDALMTYQDKEVQKAIAARKEQQAQNITDRCSAIIAVMSSMTNDEIARGITGLCDAITSLFANVGDKDARGVTWLATVHKAKGLEAPRAFILDSKLMPSRYAVQEWQQTQEQNLRYVAITRAMEELIYIDSECIE